MSSLEYVQSSLPPTEEFLQHLRQAGDQYDPVEKLLEIERELANLEQKHKLSSSDFYQRYQAGAMGDATEFVRWAGRYKQYQKLTNIFTRETRESHRGWKPGISRARTSSVGRGGEHDALAGESYGYVSV